MNIVASTPPPDPDPMSAVEPTVEEAAAGMAEDAPWRTLEYFATTRVIVASALGATLMPHTGVEGGAPSEQERAVTPR